jgi:hypothetical protein
MGQGYHPRAILLGALPGNPTDPDSATGEHAACARPHRGRPSAQRRPAEEFGEFVQALLLRVRVPLAFREVAAEGRAVSRYLAIMGNTAFPLRQELI